jgi:D-glycero-D-manno-heptose 1,7-bisphosphate phosphatase
LRRAAVDLDLDLSRSFVVGDRWHDLAAGQAVGARGVLVRTGIGLKDEAAPDASVRPAAVVDNLMDAAAWILQQHAS